MTGLGARRVGGKRVLYSSIAAALAVEAQGIMIGSLACIDLSGDTFLPMKRESWSIGTMDSLACILDVS